MKRIYLLRHAQAAPFDSAPSDKERALTPIGRAQAIALGRIMRERDLHPDFVLCSAATRTRQTLDCAEEYLDIVRTDYLENFYNAPTGELMAGLQHLPDTVPSAMIVAHNPGIHDLAVRLAKDDGSKNFNDIIMQYKPCTLTILDADIENWADLQLGENALVDVIAQ